MTSPRDEELLLELSRSSSLLVFLRAMYSLMLDYGVYLPDDADPLVFSKEQVVVLVERGKAEALVRDLPELAKEGLFRPLDPDDAALPEDVGAIVVERHGARAATVREAVTPVEPEYPEWWEAPVPFAMCTRMGMRLNPTAVVMFGADLERLSVTALPEKDEFIVELEGKGRPCFLAFRRLEPDIFTLDDCTGDLMEAQDISWWAAVGRAWISKLEADGQSWRRAETLPADFKGQAWPCEWQGRFLGYLCVDGQGRQGGDGNAAEGVESAPEAAPAKARAKASGKAAQPAAEKPVKKRTRRKAAPKEEASEASDSRKEDDVLKAIGPQTMALLAPGQARMEQPKNGQGARGQSLDVDG